MAQNLSGWRGPSSYDSGRSSLERLVSTYSSDNLMAAAANAAATTAAGSTAAPISDSRMGSGVLPGAGIYQQPQVGAPRLRVKLCNLGIHVCLNAQTALQRHISGAESFQWH